MTDTGVSSRRRFVYLVGSSAIAAWFPSRAWAVETPLVAAASSVRFALSEIVTLFERASGSTVRVSYGSTGNLYRQILQGAPFEVFLSADEGYVSKLTGSGRTVDGGAVYALGQLALAARAGSSLAIDDAMDGLRRALDEKRISRFVIANPRFAPYGQRAEETLRNAGLWDAVRPHLAYAETVAQAAQFTLSQATDGGLIALSHAVLPQMAGRLAFVPVQQKNYTPLRQRQVLIEGAGAVARAFYDFILSEDAAEVFSRNGFAIPSQSR